MKHTISKDRKTLTIEIDSEERDELRELLDIQADASMYDFLEPLVCNSDLQWINPAQTGDLTSAPSAATNTGDRSAATNTGDQSAATNTGYRSAATNTGKEGCAIALGIEGKASGEIGCWLTLSEWENKDDCWHRVDVQTRQVDGKKIKADTFYQLKGGKFVEVQ